MWKGEGMREERKSEGRGTECRNRRYSMRRREAKTDSNESKTKARRRREIKCGTEKE